MLRSFRSSLLLLIVLAAVVPVLVVSVPLFLQLSQLTREKAQQQMFHDVEHILIDVQHELDGIYSRFVSTGSNQDMVLAASSPYFAFRSTTLADAFLQASPLLESLYLFDGDLQLVQARPEVAESGELQRLRLHLRQHFQQTQRGRGQWLLLHDPTLMRQLFLTQRDAFAAADGRALLLAMPLFLDHYVPERAAQLQGVLVAVLPLQRLQQALQQRVTAEQRVGLEAAGLPLAVPVAEKDTTHVVRLAFTLRDAMPGTQPLQLVVSEPADLHEEGLRGSMWWMAAFVAGACAVFIVLALRLAQRLNHPLASLLRLANHYAGSAGTRPAPPYFYEEFGLIARALAHMGERIETQLQELRDSNEQLRQADRLKDDFLLSTSNELSAPLHGIIGIASSLSDGAGAGLSDAVRQGLRLIEDSGRQLEAMIGDIQDLARLRHHALGLELRVLSLGSLIDIVLAVLEPEAQRRQIQLCNEVPRDLPLVLADEQRLQQIIRNLAVLLLWRAGVSCMCIRAEQQNDSVLVCFADDGGVMDSGWWQRTFEEAEGRGSHGAFGLAPHLTRQLLELHGTSLQVHAGEADGLHFSFLLPVAAQEACVATPSLPRDEAPPAGKALEIDLGGPVPAGMAGGHDERADAQLAGQAHVLIVDDEAVNLQILRHYFADESWRLYLARSGAEALERLENMPQVDLILLDIMMPTMSGFEVCCRLRADPRFCQVPILFLTARAQAGDIHHAFHYGCNDYLIKPVSRVELLTRCRYHLHYARAQRELNQLRGSLQQELERQTQSLQQQLAGQVQLQEAWRALLQLGMDLSNASSVSQALRESMRIMTRVLPGDGLALMWQGQWYGSSYPALQRRLVQDLPWPQVEELRQYDVHCWPLQAGAVQGALCYWPPQLEGETGQQLEMLLNLLRLFLLRRQQQDVMDSLLMLDRDTGVWNARYFQLELMRIEKELRRSPGRQRVVLAIAIDQLLAIRHMFGEAAALALVQRVAQVLQTVLRQNDLVCRMDDAIFAVVLEGSLQECARLCLRLGQQVAAIELEVECVPPSAPVSGALGREARRGAGRTRVRTSYSVGQAGTEEQPVARLWALALARMDQAWAAREQGGGPLADVSNCSAP